MRVLTAAAVACLFAFPTVADPLPFQPVPAIISSTVMINGGCTGWYIGDDLIVTASHCMDGKLVAKVEFSNGEGGSAGARYLANIDEGGDDFAVLRLHFKTKGYAPPMEIACGVPDVGTLVYMRGFPGGTALGLGEFTSYGRIAGHNAHIKIGEWPMVVPMNMSSFGGFSGSAVRRVSDDKVVGILVGSINEQRNISFMISVVKLCHVLEI